MKRAENIDIALTGLLGILAFIAYWAGASERVLLVLLILAVVDNTMSANFRAIVQLMSEK
jgi:hypothetical protein